MSNQYTFDRASSKVIVTKLRDILKVINKKPVYTKSITDPEAQYRLNERRRHLVKVIDTVICTLDGTGVHPSIFKHVKCNMIDVSLLEVISSGCKEILNLQEMEYDDE